MPNQMIIESTEKNSSSSFIRREALLNGFVQDKTTLIYLTPENSLEIKLLFQLDFTEEPLSLN